MSDQAVGFGLQVFVAGGRRIAADWSGVSIAGVFAGEVSFSVPTSAWAGVPVIYEEGFGPNNKQGTQQ